MFFCYSCVFQYIGMDNQEYTVCRILGSYCIKDLFVSHKKLHGCHIRIIVVTDVYSMVFWRLLVS
jgi:hypothetical protein